MPKSTELVGYWWNVDSLRTHKENGWARLVADQVLEVAWVDDPDWFCIQEAHSYPGANLVEMIGNATGWNPVFEPSVRYGNGPEGRIEGDDFTEGLATFSKHPIKDHQTVVLGPNPQAKGKGWHCEQHLLDTTLETPGSDITVGNVHLSVIRPHYIRARSKEISAFKDHILDRDLSQPYIVGGDINTLRFMPSMLSLGLAYDWRSGSWKKPTWSYGGDPERRFRKLNLDAFGVPKDGPLKIQGARVLERGGSDHRKLRAECVLEHLIDQAA